MTDYISRKTAYQFFKDQLEEETGAYSKGRNAGLRVAMSAVMNNDAIPAADVRPNVTGKFYLQYNGDGCWHCSECNCQARYLSNFCPNCGADMKGEVE